MTRPIRDRDPGVPEPGSQPAAAAPGEPAPRAPTDSASDARSTLPAEPRAAEPFERSLARELTDELGLTAPTPPGGARPDARIREDVCERLWADLHIDVGEVSVEVKNGVVLLEGSVPERPMKYRIEDIAAGCRGVHDVENRIRVVATPSPPGAGIV